MDGPLCTQDGDTMVVKSRRIIPIPHSMVGLFLAQPNGVTPRYYFETIYPQLVTDGIVDDCLSMTHFFQIAITRKGNNQDESFLETTQPSAPNRNPTLIKHQLELLHIITSPSSALVLYQLEIPSLLKALVPLPPPNSNYIMTRLKLPRWRRNRKRLRSGWEPPSAISYYV